jgi:hypothetical protein
VWVADSDRCAQRGKSNLRFVPHEEARRLPIGSRSRRKACFAILFPKVALYANVSAPEKSTCAQKLSTAVRMCSMRKKWVTEMTAQTCLIRPPLAIPIPVIITEQNSPQRKSTTGSSISRRCRNAGSLCRVGPATRETSAQRVLDCHLTGTFQILAT